MHSTASMLSSKSHASPIEQLPLATLVVIFHLLRYTQMTWSVTVTAVSDFNAKLFWVVMVVRYYSYVYLYKFLSIHFSYGLLHYLLLLVRSIKICTRLVQCSGLI